MPKILKSVILSLFFIVIAYLAACFVYPNGKIYNVTVFPKIFPEVPYKLGLDLAGGIHLTYQGDLSKIPEQDRVSTMNGLKDVIERRVNYFGVREPIIQVQKDKLIVELAGVIDPEQAIKEIGKTPYLEFKQEKSNYQEILEKNQKILAEGKGAEGLEDPFEITPLTGKYLTRADIDFDSTTYKPVVSITFNAEGAKIFSDLTEKNVKKHLAIFIDGQMLSNPVVQEKISGGRAQISGNFTEKEARNLAENLNAGALPIPINIVSQEVVGPFLGKISLEQIIKAGLIGFAAVAVFMIIFYRFLGLFAIFALILFVIFNLFVYKLGVTLTLAGLAGFIISMGMAVDANILIFTRMREEMKSGFDFLSALDKGVVRAWPAIRDGNFTTILIALILFFLGTSFVKGFALTLIIGNILGMLTAILVTNNFLKCVPDFLRKPKFLWK